MPHHPSNAPMQSGDQLVEPSVLSQAYPNPMTPSKKQNYDKAAGEPPNRNGSRRLITTDEAQTPYHGQIYRDELTGVTLKTRSSFQEDVIQFLTVEPHDPSRPSRAASTDWLLRLAIQEDGGIDLGDTESPDVDTPLPGYTAETTEDYRDASPEDPRGDGVYRRDYTEGSLTEQIADIVTRNGGRLPRDFSASVQNEGYARSRDWTVYAPGQNPYHIAAAITDLLEDADGISSNTVHVDNRTPREKASALRADRVGYVFSPDEEDLIERFLQEIRWEAGLPSVSRRALIVTPSEAAKRVETGDFSELITEDRIEERIRDLARAPGDTCDHVEIRITAHEDADSPYYG